MRLRYENLRTFWFPGKGKYGFNKSIEKKTFIILIQDQGRSEDKLTNTELKIHNSLLISNSRKTFSSMATSIWCLLKTLVHFLCKTIEQKLWEKRTICLWIMSLTMSGGKACVSTFLHRITGNTGPVQALRPSHSNCSRHLPPLDIV